MKKCFTVNCMRTNEDFDGYEMLIRENIYQAVELFYPYNVSDVQRNLYTNRVNKLIKMANDENINLEVVLHLPHGPKNDLLGNQLDVLSNDVMNRMKKAIDYANLFNVKKLTLHLGSYKGYNTREEAINEVITLVQDLCDYAHKYNMFIMIENMPGYNELGYSPEEILYIIKRVNKDNIKFILDTGHAHCSSYPLSEYVNLLNEYLYHMHFNDNNGERDEHKRVNSGTIDFKKLFEELNKIGYKELHCMEVLFKTYQDLIDYAKDIDIYDIFYK